VLGELSLGLLAEVEERGRGNTADAKDERGADSDPPFACTHA
jgi:hypothetical protein